MERPFNIPMDVVSYRRVKTSTAYLFLAELFYAHCRSVLLLYLEVSAQFSFINKAKKHVKIWYSNDQQTEHRDFCAPRHYGIAKIDNLYTTVAT